MSTEVLPQLLQILFCIIYFLSHSGVFTASHPSHSKSMLIHYKLNNATELPSTLSYPRFQHTVAETCSPIRQNKI